MLFHPALGDWLRDPKRSGTYCIQADGGQAIGEFLWGRFLQICGSSPTVTSSILLEDHPAAQTQEWIAQIVDWIASLTPQTRHWHSLADLVRLPRWLEHHGRYSESIQMARRYLELANTETGDEATRIAAGHLLSDLLSIYQEHLGEAESLSRSTLERSRRHHGAASQEAARAAHALGNLLALQGRDDEAVPCYQEALAIRQRQLGWKHGATHLSLQQVSDLLIRLGRHAQAEQLLSDAQAAARLELGEHHPRTRSIEARMSALAQRDHGA